jgi:hypothetical protein
MAGPFSSPPRPGAADGTVGGPSLAVGGNNAGGGPAGGVVNQVNFQQLIKAIQQLAQYTKQSLGAAASGDLSGIYPGPISVVSTHLTNPLPLAQGGTGNTTGQPSGAAGGDLSGNYPDPTVTGVHLSAPLPVSQGGTGLTSGTSGGILAFSADNALVSSGLLAQYELVLGGGAGVAPSTLGSLGTTVTVYHGNAAGAGAFGPVALTTDVSGVLPLANGGTNNTTGQPAGTAGGDLSGTYPNPAIAQIAGQAVAPGAWTPSDGSGASLSFTAVSARVTRLGNAVIASAALTYPSTVSASNAVVAGFPVNFPNQTYAQGPCEVYCAGAATGVLLVPIPNTNTAKLVNPVGGAALTNTNLSTLTLTFTLIYQAT